MRINRQPVWLLVLTLAGVGLTGSPAAAFWPHHSEVVFRQRTVYRGPGFAGGFVGAVPVAGANEMFPLVSTREFAPLGFTTELAPLGMGFESFRVVSSGSSSLNEAVRQEVSRQVAENARLEAGKVSAPSTSTGTGGTATGTGAGGVSAATSGLAARMDKIEERLKNLSDKVDGIEAKVNQLLADKAQQQQDQRTLKLVTAAVTEVSKQQNATYAALIREALKPAEQRDQKKIDALLKSLDPSSP
jgi:hypothetical protein